MPRPRGRRGRPTDYDWEGAFIAQTTVVAGASAQFVIGTSDTAETLMRVRGIVSAHLDQGGSTVADSCVIAFGLIVGSTGAVLAIDPVVEPGANWLWHSFMLLNNEFVVSATNPERHWQQRLEIDNKAMRKLREDEQLFLIVANADVNGAPVAIVNGAFRVLTGR